MGKNQPFLMTFIKNNSLALAMFGLFFLFLMGHSFAGFLQENEVLQEHAQPPITYIEYVTGGEFTESVFENWESEFLQMWALVILTIYLRQKGSKDSKKLLGKEEVDMRSRYSIIKAQTWGERGQAIKHAVYSNSLGLALLLLFIVSFVAHAFGGAAAYNEESLQHSQPTVTVLEYIGTSTFWFESFQNWQSEFLAVGSLLVLSIFLRQRGSPESKPVAASNAKTGE